MLEFIQTSLHVKKLGEAVPLIDSVSFKIPKSHWMAIIGHPNTGNTSLLELVLGTQTRSSGDICWDGKALPVTKPFHPNDIGWISPTPLIHPSLTVDETIEFAIRLRSTIISSKSLSRKIEHTLEIAGLESISDSPIDQLTLSEKRRLELACQLITSPKIVLCDNITQDLSPREELKICQLLRDQADVHQRIIISAQGSLANYQQYDSILLLQDGRLIFHGTPAQLTHYFSVKDTSLIPARLASQAPESWQFSWEKHRLTYENNAISAQATPEEPSSSPPTPPSTPALPNLLIQFSTLLSRRWRIFFRNRSHLAVQVSFVILICLSPWYFAPASESSDTVYLTAHGKAMVLLIQAILTALLGIHNGSREISSERSLFLKEHREGLSPSAFITSKIAFLCCLVIAQSLSIGYLSHSLTPSHSRLILEISFLFLINSSFTAASLAISALTRRSHAAFGTALLFLAVQTAITPALPSLSSPLISTIKPAVATYSAWLGIISTRLPTEQRQLLDSIYCSASSAFLSAWILAAYTALAILIAWLAVIHIPKHSSHLAD